jgi:hypothetical protein
MPSAHPVTDHHQIRQWAEARDAKPSCVRRTGGKGDPGMIRLDFPGYSGAQSLSRLSWDEWFKAFDDNNLALLVQDTTARGQKSNCNKLVSRESITDGLPPQRQRKGAGRAAARRTTKSAGRAQKRSAGGTAARKSSGAARTKATSASKAGQSKSETASAKTSPRRASGKRTTATATVPRSARVNAPRRVAHGRRQAEAVHGSHAGQPSGARYVRCCRRG